MLFSVVQWRSQTFLNGGEAGAGVQIGRGRTNTLLVGYVIFFSFADSSCWASGRASTLAGGGGGAPGPSRTPRDYATAVVSCFRHMPIPFDECVLFCTNLIIFLKWHRSLKISISVSESLVESSHRRGIWSARRTTEESLGENRASHDKDSAELSKMVQKEDNKGYILSPDNSR